MGIERDLLIRLRGENADLRAKLAESEASLEQFKAANAGVAPEATAAAAALTEEGAAARAASSGLTQAAAGGAELSAANVGVAATQETVVAALREARTALSSLAAAAQVGGPAMAEALGAAAIAVAGLEAEIAAVQASGGVVTPAQLEGLAVYQARLAGLIAQIQATSGAQTGAATTTRSSTAATVQESEAVVADTAAHAGLKVELGATSAARTAATTNTRLYSAATAQGSAAIAGKTVNLGALTSGFLRFLGPIGLATAAIALLPTLVRTLSNAFKEYYNWIVQTVRGTDDFIFATRKAGESLEDYDKRVNAARDDHELLARALAAARAGVIEYTGDIDKLKASYLLHQAAAQGSITKTKEMEAAAKEFGIAIAESFTLEEARSSIVEFMKQYEDQLKIGENAARRFVDINKGNISLWVQAHDDAGHAIPQTFIPILRQYDILTPKQKEAIENAKKEADANKKAAEEVKRHSEAVEDLVSEFDKSLRAYRDSAAEIEKHRSKSVGAARDEADSRRASTIQQMQALSAQYNSFAISGAEYQAKFAALQNEEVAARRAAEAEESRINDEARIDTVDLQKKMQDKTKVIIEELAKEGVSFTNALDKHIVYKGSLDSMVRKINTEWAPAHRDAATFIAGTGTALLNLATDAIPKVEGSIDGLIIKVGALIVKMNDLDVASSRALKTGGVPQGAVTTEAPGGSVTTEPSFS